MGSSWGSCGLLCSSWRCELVGRQPTTEGQETAAVGCTVSRARHLLCSGHSGEEGTPLLLSSLLDLMYLVESTVLVVVKVIL